MHTPYFSITCQNTLLLCPRMNSLDQHTNCGDVQLGIRPCHKKTHTMRVAINSQHSRVHHHRCTQRLIAICCFTIDSINSTTTHSTAHQTTSTTCVVCRRVSNVKQLHSIYNLSAANVFRYKHRHDKTTVHAPQFSANFITRPVTRNKLTSLCLLTIFHTRLETFLFTKSYPDIRLI